MDALYAMGLVLKAAAVDSDEFFNSRAFSGLNEELDGVEGFTAYETASEADHAFCLEMANNPALAMQIAEAATELSLSIDSIFPYGNRDLATLDAKTITDALAFQGLTAWAYAKENPENEDGYLLVISRWPLRAPLDRVMSVVRHEQ